MTTVFKLGLGQVNLLRRVLADVSLSVRLEAAVEKGEHLAKGKYPTGRYSFECSVSECARIRDLLSDKLLEVGVDENGEVNAVGRNLDDLIDLFSSDEL